MPKLESIFSHELYKTNGRKVSTVCFLCTYIVYVFQSLVCLSGMHVKKCNDVSTCMYRPLAKKTFPKSVFSHGNIVGAANGDAGAFIQEQFKRIELLFLGQDQVILY